MPGDPLPERRRQARRRGLLDDLLVAPLHRAVALSQPEHRPVAVAHQLHLDVPRAPEVALAVDRPVTEGGLGLARRGLEGVVQVGLVLDDPHPASASARGCLDEQREAELGRIAGRERRDADARSDPLRLELVSAPAQDVRRRADPRQPRRDDRLRERRALGEEAVSGVDERRARGERRRDERIGVEVGRHLDRLVGDPRVHGTGIARPGHGHRPDAEPPARGEDADRDLTAVGDEELPSGAHRRDTIPSGRIGRGMVTVRAGSYHRARREDDDARDRLARAPVRPRRRRPGTAARDGGRPRRRVRAADAGDRRARRDHARRRRDGRLRRRSHPPRAAGHGRARRRAAKAAAPDRPRPPGRRARAASRRWSGRRGRRPPRGRT